MQIQGPIARASRIAAITALFCASLWTVQDAVLCVSPDGSVAVEAAGPDGACLARPTQRKADAAQMEADCPHNAACAGCTDFSLDQLPAGIHSDDAARRGAPALCVALVADAASGPPEGALTASACGRRRTRSPAPETPLHLASTVLQR